METISTMTRHIAVKKKLYTATPTRLPLYQTRARTTHSVTDHKLYKQVLISGDGSVSPPCHTSIRWTLARSSHRTTLTINLNLLLRDRIHRDLNSHTPYTSSGCSVYVYIIHKYMKTLYRMVSGQRLNCVLQGFEHACSPNASASTSSKLSYQTYSNQIVDH
jgi:hypothetical protein